MTDGIGADADGCDLGDERLNARYRLLLDRLADQPGRSIPAACRGDAEVDAAYRVLDNPKVTPAKLLAPHRAATLRRVAAEKVVVVAQDTTAIDLTRPTRVVGGPLSEGYRRGFYSHTLLALTPAGVPLGVLADRTWARNPDTVGRSKRDRERTPLTDKESVRWVDGYRTCCDAARATPGVRGVCVSDSDGDLYEAFVEAERQGHAARVVVRACHDRRLAGGEGQFLRDTAAAAPVLATRAVEVSARPGKPSETRVRRKARGERQAVLPVRAVTVTPRPPLRPDGRLPAASVTAVLAREENPPPGEEAIEWLLLTDLPAGTAAEAERVLDVYTLRWQIEVLFRVLKSGCGVDKLQLETAERVLNALAIYRVVAWRVLRLTMLGRATPEVPCEVVRSESEWKAV